MQRSNVRRRSRLRGYRACALPFAACLLIFPFFSFQGVTRDWKVQATGWPVLAVERLLKPCDTRATERCESKFANALKAENANLTTADWETAVSAAGLINWRFMTGLVLVVMLCALLIAGYIVWHTPCGVPSARRWAVTLGLLVASAALFLALYAAGIAENATVIVRQFLRNVEAHLIGARLVDYEMGLLLLGYTMVVYLLCASAATLVPFCPRHAGAAPVSELEAERQAEYLAARMRHLRLILYVGALALVVTLARTNLNFRWSLDYLPPLDLFPEKSAELAAAKLVYQRLENVVTNMLTGNAIMNMIVLASLYVPAALVLQARAKTLSERAARLELLAPAHGRQAEDDEEQEGVAPDSKGGAQAKDAPKAPSPEEWMRARGLAFPLKEHLKQIAAILSPLLAGPAAELLGFLKG